MVALEPNAFPVSLVALFAAWMIPALYARRGALVARPRRRIGQLAERRALGLLADLVGHEARELLARTGMVLEPGRLGIWLVAESGALLVAPGGRRVSCFCVYTPEPGLPLPSGDRIAHLLLALRSDETGFATVANVAFSGAPWRIRRCLDRGMRPALDRAVAAARHR